MAKGGVASEQTSPPSLPRGARNLVRSVVPPFPARTASLGSRGSPAFAIPLKTTKKGASAPFLDHSRSLVSAIAYSTSTKRDADVYQTDRRGSRNTLRLSRADSTRKGCAASVARLTALTAAQSRPPLRALLKAISSGSMWASTPTSLIRSESSTNFIRQIFNGR